MPSARKQNFKKGSHRSDFMSDLQDMNVMTDNYEGEM